MDDVYKYLPNEIIPQVSIEYNNSGAVETIDVVRVFEVIPGHIYKEYYNSYSGKSFQLYNAEFNFSTSGYSNSERLTYDDFLKYYPDVIDIRKIPTLGYAADIKRLFKADLYKPLKRIDMISDKIQEVESNHIVPTVCKDDKMSDMGYYSNVYVGTLKTINSDLLRENKVLKKENEKLKEQIRGLSSGLLSQSFVTDELVNIFSKE